MENNVATSKYLSTSKKRIIVIANVQNSFKASKYFCQHISIFLSSLNTRQNIIFILAIQSDYRHIVEAAKIF